MIVTQWIIAGSAGLVVSAGSVGTAENLAARMTDREVTEQVIARIAASDPSIASSIGVSTRAGVVTLTGPKLTPGDVLVVTRDADDTRGVVRVENRLGRM
jgi:osmotically-inducible protein OsmY